jgi:hypothetical protein
MSCGHCHFPRCGPDLYQPIGIDLVYNSAKLFSSSNKFCSSRGKFGFVLFL